MLHEFKAFADRRITVTESGDDSEGWREGCDDCQRRTSQSYGDWVVVMDPPPIIVFECEFRIEPDKP